MALRIAYVHCVASTYSFNSFASYIFSNILVIATVHTIALSPSYLCCNSLALVSKLCRLGSSCRLVSTSSYCSKSAVQSVTVASTAIIASLITASGFSLTYGGVEGCSFNSRSIIFRFSSKLNLFQLCLCIVHTCMQLPNLSLHRCFFWDM